VPAGASGSNLVKGNFGSGQSYFNNPAFFAASGANFNGLNCGSLRGPNTWTYNLALLKNFHVYERFNFQLRAEAFNLANTVQPYNPITNINSPAFGQTTTLYSNGALRGAFGREVKFGGQVQF
jgi:hypothetical protein